MRGIIYADDHLEVESERPGLTICYSAFKPVMRSLIVKHAMLAIGLSGTVKRQCTMLHVLLPLLTYCHGKPSRACKLTTHLVAQWQIPWCLFMCTLFQKCEATLQWSQIIKAARLSPLATLQGKAVGGRLNMHG